MMNEMTIGRYNINKNVWEYGYYRDTRFIILGVVSV